ncbi:MAG TPA: SAM-dependent methyltransferase [Acidimicrobiales bacterium]|nr:SAM-dependent methyltransferase [Acidimicrobiales bacterium]
MAPPRPRLVPLLDALAKQHPEVTDPEAMLAAQRVRVDGSIVTNPRARIRSDAGITIRPEDVPRGRDKLGGALRLLGVDVHDRVCLDVGASTGGFTLALLEGGAGRVYAVDVGHGQLLGRLRADPRVVNLERTNVADLTPALVPEPVSTMVVDVSRLSLGEAVRQATERVPLDPEAVLVGLVKPMFELRRGDLPSEPEDLADACDRAATAVDAAGWTVLDVVDSPLRGARGAVEYFLHARRG